MIFKLFKSVFNNICHGENFENFSHSKFLAIQCCQVIVNHHIRSYTVVTSVYYRTIDLYRIDAGIVTVIIPVDVTTVTSNNMAATVPIGELIL